MALEFTIEFRVNGDIRRAEITAADQVLADYLRDACHATDVMIGCREGACGACTVLVDGAAVTSCLVPLARVDGTSVRTPADLAGTDAGAEITAALVEHRAMQCGFCTPGILTAIYALLVSGARAMPADELRGHLCRCAAYRRILAAADQLSADAGRRGAARR